MDNAVPASVNAFRIRHAHALKLAAGLILCLSFLLALHLMSPRLVGLESSVVRPQSETSSSLTYEVSSLAGAAPHVLYIPAAGGVRAISSVSAAGSQALPMAVTHRLSGFGFASSAIHAPVGVDTEARPLPLTLHLGVDYGRVGVPRAFVIPSAVASEIAETQRLWVQSIRVPAFIVAVISGLVFMLLISSNPPYFATGALGALAYVVLAQTLARESAIGNFFGAQIGGAEYFLALWAASAIAGTPNTLAGGPRFGRVLVILFALSNVFVFFVGEIDSAIMTWAPAAIFSPVLLAGCMRSWQAARDPQFSALHLGVMLLALTAAALGLVRAAEPRLFSEAFTLTTIYSLGSLPLLTVGAVSLGRHAFASWRSSLAKLQADYAAQSAELGRVGALLQEEARQRMLFEERSRITRDMHDGIGGRLLSLLIRVRAGRLDIKDVEREVQESLNDLRLIVDSLDSAGESLGAALQSFRARAERQLSGAGMVLTWREDARAVDGITLEPQAMLDIFRVLQESVSNAVNHAGASNVAISIGRKDDSLSFVIADDGRGFAPDAGNSRGKGLKNMKARAARLGAELNIASDGQNGTRVELTKALQPADQSSTGSSSQPN